MDKTRRERWLKSEFFLYYNIACLQNLLCKYLDYGFDVESSSRWEKNSINLLGGDWKIGIRLFDFYIYECTFSIYMLPRYRSGLQFQDERTTFSMVDTLVAKLFLKIVPWCALISFLICVCLFFNKVSPVTCSCSLCENFYSRNFLTKLLKLKTFTSNGSRPAISTKL